MFLLLRLKSQPSRSLGACGRPSLSSRSAPEAGSLPCRHCCNTRLCLLPPRNGTSAHRDSDPGTHFRWGPPLCFADVLQVTQPLPQHTHGMHHFQPPASGSFWSDKRDFGQRDLPSPSGVSSCPLCPPLEKSTEMSSVGGTGRQRHDTEHSG